MEGGRECPRTSAGARRRTMARNLFAGDGRVTSGSFAARDRDDPPATTSTCSRHALLTIDLDAVVANYRTLRRQLGRTACAAVVKADAYGLGAARVAPALFDVGCRTFFVAQVSEGVALRPHLPDAAAIVVLHGCQADEATTCLHAGLTPVLNSVSQLAAWAALSRARDRRLPAYVQLDTGMSRFGLSSADVDALDRRDLDAIALAGVMSHLARADEPDDPFNGHQLATFETLRARLPAAPASLAASSGCFLPADYHFDLARPGAALYGVAPQPGRANPMRPVARLDAAVLQLRTVPAGTPVGYGGTARTAAATRLATVGVGYADGYLRSGGNAGCAWYGDTPLPVVGRVSMDSLVLDAGAVSDPALTEGAMVTIIGPHRDVDALGRDLGTSGYEVLTGLGHRYARRYVPHDDVAGAIAREEHRP